SDLLALLPRAQYVGYTATPFANVFIDPSDAEDIFPKDFIVSLPQPEGYMGIQAFHDLGSDIPRSERTVANSNEKAYVRGVASDEDDDAALREAIDAYVLAGAMKLYREDNGYRQKTFKHHTMLIHESVRMADHRELLVRTKTLWYDSGYFGPAGHERLRRLYDTDFKPVSDARAAGYPVPASYDELSRFVGPAVARIGGDDNPVIVVNGDKEIETGEADFDKRPIWKILIGGQKLSRGFTVEGLTISYFRRASASASTLMQMGRWFGFRDGYGDLVRLYLGRNETLGSKTVDLLEAFEAICMDEDRFRGELARYAKPGNGSVAITPAQVPPLVYQHLPWLPPVSRTKMFNARLVEVSSAGQWQEPTAYPTNPTALRTNFELWKPFLEALSEDQVDLMAPNPLTDKTDKCPALLGSITADSALAVFEKALWMNPDNFAPHLSYLRSITQENKVDDWLIVAPQHTTSAQRASLGGARQFSWFARNYRSNENKLFGAISSPRHRTALLRIAGALTDPGNAATESLVEPKRGVIAVYPIVLPVDQDSVAADGELRPEKTVMAFAFVAPSSARSADGQVVRFSTIDSTKTGPIIDV
ncbi:Z1 domain-containing protein, partial [Gordonia sp. (in: high G+C Gram-positive bacteria)]|uniref:Z1 domain-containing protein n=1 Tax=Gordonia sp. (in: high G+C Gram-positive bacteria) TaxID=84139 RepID=UPI003C71A8A6